MSQVSGCSILCTEHLKEFFRLVCGQLAMLKPEVSSNLARQLPWVWWTALELTSDHSVLSVLLGEALPQCRPCREVPQRLTSAATACCYPIITVQQHLWLQHWTQRWTPKGKREQNCSWHIGNSYSLGSAATKSSSWSGKGDQVDKHSRVCS